MLIIYWQTQLYWMTCSLSVSVQSLCHYLHMCAASIAGACRKTGSQLRVCFDECLIASDSAAGVDQILDQHDSGNG